VQDSKLRSRLKAQLTKFCSDLCEGLSRPLEKFVGQMLFGIQASQDVKLSNIARSLKEEIPLIKTEDRLSRNLRAVELEAELTRQLAKMASQRITADTVLCLDLSDIRKEYAKKMEYLATVHDGSTGEMHPGYWLCDITGAEMKGSEIVPLYQKMYSAEAKEFVSENAEVLAGIDLVRSHTQGRGIWALDRGGDRKKLLEPLLDRHERFVIRSTGRRFVVDRKNIKRSVAELGARCRLRHSARIVKIQDGQEKIYDLRYGVERIRLLGRDEPLHLVVVAGFGEEPLLLLTNALEGARDSQSLWWIAQIYLMRWKIGVSRKGHIVQSVRDRPRLKDSGLVAGEAPWRESKAAEPSDNMLGKEYAQRIRLQRAVNVEVASLHEFPVAETVDNARKQQELTETSPIRQFSPAGYQRRHDAKDDVETGEALDARRRKLAEEMPAITAIGKFRHRHQGDGSGRNTVDGRAAKRARREGPGPVSTPSVKVRQG
jgi:hypothetical protein